MKLLIGGSPCTHWSIAQTKNRETTAEGIGWELFLNYRIARDKYQPDYFLYENNKSMSPTIRSQITAELGVEPVLIDSGKVSAQSRQRLYWVGKRELDGTYRQVTVKQPEDRGILLRDILETPVTLYEKSCNQDVNYDEHPNSFEFIDYSPRRASSIQTNENGIRCVQPNGATCAETCIRLLDGKGGALIAARPTKIIQPINIDFIKDDVNSLNCGTQQYRLCRSDIPTIYLVQNERITIKGEKYPIKLQDGYYIIRNLTVTECKRLQTVPDTYLFPVSKIQAYKMLGNGWTVDVIAHIMSHFDGLTEKKIEVLSMYDGMSCGHIALDKLGVDVMAYYATEIDKYAIQTTQHNFPDTVQLGDAFQVRDDAWRLYGQTDN